MQNWLCAFLAAVVFFFSANPSFAELSSTTEPDPYLAAMQALSEGRFDEARRALGVLLERAPNSPGKWLDLATLRCSLGDADEAERLFREIESRFLPPSAIVEVINLQRATGCRGRQKESFAVVRFGRGYDSNANQGVSNPYFSIGSGSNRIDLVVLPSYRPSSDHCSVLSAEYIGDVSFVGSAVGFVQFRARQYDSLSRLNLASLQAGFEKDWRLGGWLLKGGASVGATTLGDKSYLNQGQLFAQVLPPLGLPNGWQFLVSSSLSSFFYPAFSAFNGNTFELRSSVRYKTENTVWQVSGGALYDQQVNPRPGGDRKGGFASVDGVFSLASGVSAELAWQHQQWLASEDYSPGLIDHRRQQKTQVLRASVNFALDRNNSILSEFQRIDNRENISLFQYSGYIFQMSWLYRFGA